MSGIASLADLRACLADLPEGDDSAAAAIATRQSRLTKPLGSLGRLEELVAWLGRWQGQEAPRLDDVSVLVFAGNHGVVARGVSAYPASVTAQMVANFEAGGAAINQICKSVGASLRVIPLNLDTPTADFTEKQAMTEAEFVEAVAAGYDAVPASADLVCLGEMGIGNTTAASALAAALLGGGGERWAGRGTGLDDAGLARKREAIDAGLTRHRDPSRRPARREHDLRRPRACRDPWRNARRPPSWHSRVARRLRRHRGGRAARAARARRSRSCPGRALLR